jgi:hypothetical protein
MLVSIYNVGDALDYYYTIVDTKIYQFKLSSCEATDLSDQRNAVYSIDLKLVSPSKISYMKWS